MRGGSSTAAWLGFINKIFRAQNPCTFGPFLCDFVVLCTTGRIGSRRHLAENAWLVSLGCSGGAQRPCRVYLHIIQRLLQGKPILLKIGRFSLYACGNGLDLPHLAKRAFRDQIGPNVQKAMLLGSPSHQGLKNCGFSQIYIFFIF